VPLGLVKRETKERPQLDRGFDPSADRGSEFYRIETTPIEHDDFLQAVIDQQPGEHIVILGEPGAGKTTLLTRVWQSLLEQMNSEALMIVAWVPLAALTNQGLAGYLEDVWLHKFCGDNKSSYWESFKELAAAGWVYLLLDGADEMGGDGLTKIQSILEQSWKKLRVVITCRLNLWDGGSQNVLKEQFKIFRTLDFSYDNPDRVQQFIDKWFEGAEAGRSLRSALDEVGKERIKDLAQNPLRLTLLCNIWQKSGGLPDTQAGLYEQFVNFVYGWSKVLDARELQLELDRAMGQLAKYGINKPVLRFRFTERELQAQVPNIEHRKALKALGWLNCVGEDREGNEVYAFFHPTFQEYFAACSIDDWDYFLPRAHVDRPLPCLGEEEIGPTYRVFESEWRQPIVLWFGRGDVDDKDKEKFIEKLTTFQDGVEGFYNHRAYFMAAICTGEFRNSTKAQDIVNEIVKQAFGYWDEKQEWQSFYLLKPLAISIVPLAHRDYVIESLMQLLENKISNHVFDITQTLEQVTIGRKDVIERIIVLLEKKESEISRSLLELLSKIVIKEDQVIDRLIKILKKEDFHGQPAHVCASVDIVLRRIAMDKEEAIEALLSTLDNCNHGYNKRIRILGRAKICKKNVIEKLFAILEQEDLYNNTDLCDSVTDALKNISDDEGWVIDRLIKLVDGKEGETRLYINVIEIFGSIAVGNQNAINYLTGVITHKNITTLIISHTVLDALEKIAIGNRIVIERLFELLNSKQIRGDKISKVLGVIAIKEEWFIEKVNESIADELFDCDNLHCAIRILGIVGVGSQKVIEILNILVRKRDLKPLVRFVISDSLLKTDPNKNLAISELESLLGAEVDQDIYFGTVYSLLMNTVDNPLAIKALKQILNNMDDPDPLLRIQSLLEQFAIDNEEIIQMLLHFWGDGGLKFNINIVVSAILAKIAIGNEAVIKHALELLAARKFAGSALSVLGRIAVGHRSVTGEVVKLLMQNELPWESRQKLVVILKMIATRETGELVISSLKNHVAQEYFDSNPELWTACVDILLHYSQILSYQKFHELWKTNGLLFIHIN
jgi:NACHT domain